MFVKLVELSRDNNHEYFVVDIDSTEHEKSVYASIRLPDAIGCTSTVNNFICLIKDWRNRYRSDNPIKINSKVSFFEFLLGLETDIWNMLLGHTMENMWYDDVKKKYFSLNPNGSLIYIYGLRGCYWISTLPENVRCYIQDTGLFTKLEKVVRECNILRQNEDNEIVFRNMYYDISNKEWNDCMLEKRSPIMSLDYTLQDFTPTENKKFLSFIEDIFPNKGTRDFFWHTSWNILTRQNPGLYIFEGDCCSGKTTITKLFEATFVNVKYMPETWMFPNCERIEEAMKNRLFINPEIHPENKPYKSQLVHKYFKEDRDFNTFRGPSILTATNDVKSVIPDTKPNRDTQIQERTFIIPFTNNFRNNMDNTIRDKIKNYWKDLFMWNLIEMNNSGKFDQPITIPLQIMEASAKYRGFVEGYFHTKSK